MKPRLDSAPPVPEDDQVWIRALNKTRMPSFVWHWYNNADRRDADLMLRARGYSKFAMKYQRTLFTELNPPDMDGMPPIGGVLVGGDQR